MAQDNLWRQNRIPGSRSKNPLFVDYFAQYAGSQDYLDMTAQTTANAIRCKTVSDDDYIATITVDSLRDRRSSLAADLLLLAASQRVEQRPIRGPAVESAPHRECCDNRSLNSSENVGQVRNPTLHSPFLTGLNALHAPPPQPQRPAT